MIETILEEIRGLNLPLFWLTESEHGKRTTWSFVPDNPCNDIYSVTKVFTVTALGFLYDQGLWKPDDKICDLFRKKLPGRYDPQWEEVTLDHVIRHRIGVTEDFLDIDNYDMTQFGSEDFLKLAFERPVPARPGVDYQYSDGAYYLLSRVVTELSGEKLDDFLRPRLLMPLHVRERLFQSVRWGIRLERPACMCAQRTWQSLARSIKTVAHLKESGCFRKSGSSLFLSGNMSLQRWKTEGTARAV